MKTFTHAFFLFMLGCLFSYSAFAQDIADSRHTPGTTRSQLPIAFEKAANAARQTGRVAGKLGKWAATVVGIKKSPPAQMVGVVNLTPSHTRMCSCGPDVVHLKEGEWFFFPAPLFPEFISDSLSYYATLSSGETLPEWIYFQARDHSFVAASKNFKTGIYLVRFVCFNGREEREKTFKIHVESPKVETSTNR